MSDESPSKSPEPVTELPTSTPEVRIDESATLEDMKTSVRVIEGLFHAINAASFPLRMYGDVMQGMQFLKAVHDGLIKKLGPEEVNKIRQSEAFKAQATVPASGPAN